MKEECLICKAPLKYIEKAVMMESEICRRSAQNNQCIGRRCPFSPANHRSLKV